MSNKRTGNYDKYARLLKKYNTRQPAEKMSIGYYKEESKNARIKEFLNMSEYIMDSMKLIGTQRRDVKWLIRNVSFNELNRQIRAECIILCLCIYIRRSYGDRNFRWQEYGLVKKYGLTCNTLLTVITNLCIWYSRRGVLPHTDNIDKYGTLVIEGEEEDDDTMEYLTKTGIYPRYIYRKILK